MPIINKQVNNKQSALKIILMVRGGVCVCACVYVHTCDGVGGRAVAKMYTVPVDCSLDTRRIFVS